MHETPSANRLRIAFFGPRNARKSTLVNASTGQDAAIVSDVPGTTTDPVSKAMEIPPLGPCLVTDTAGLDDEGELGAMRVRRTLEVLAEGCEDGQYYGRSYMDAPDIDTKVYFTSENEIEPGSYLPVLITDTCDYDLIGIAQPKEEAK